jgi:hypothetical protein
MFCKSIHLPASLAAIFLTPTWEARTGAVGVGFLEGGFAAGCIFSSFAGIDLVVIFSAELEEAWESLEGDGEAAFMRFSIAKRFWRIYDSVVSFERDTKGSCWVWGRTHGRGDLELTCSAGGKVGSGCSLGSMLMVGSLRS